MNTNKNSLTILTDPIPSGFVFWIELVKQILRFLKRKYYSIPNYLRSHYRGHPAVTRSLYEGMLKIGVRANYNPNNMAEVAEVVVVLSGISALKQAIKLKKKGKIKKLLAGPNLVNYPSDRRKIIASSEVDICITPSFWTDTLYQKDCPELIGRCQIWPAGVDTEYWIPQKDIRKDLVLIYRKNTAGPIDSITPYVNWLINNGNQVEVLNCGNYSSDEYRELLSRSKIMIGFVYSESQGLAWAEAWAMDVPTLIWSNSARLSLEHKDKSTAPYISSHTGSTFENFESFKKSFSLWENGALGNFSPRKWVIENMSDQAVARQFCKLANIKF